MPIVHRFGNAFQGFTPPNFVIPKPPANFTESTKLVGHPDPDPKLNIPLIIGAVAVLYILFNK